MPTSSSSIRSSDGAFLSPAVMRQPADALGPRARRTIARIIHATREVFLTRGYAGTTIDEIARVADVSRASFYTYFPSKREVLLAVGANAAEASEAMIDQLSEYAGSRAALKIWATKFLELLDVHGSFGIAWTQAAMEDEEIRIAGMKRHYGLCRRIGANILATTGKKMDDPGPLGLVVMSMFERGWQYGELYRE